MLNMCRFTFALLAIMAGSAFGGAIMPRRVPDLDGRIVGGEDTTIENYPHQVSVRLFGAHSCGGSIYSPRIVLTAGHCVYTMLDAKYYSVQHGSTNLASSDNIILAESVIKNPNYNSNTITNDVALIILVSEILFSATAQPIDLAWEDPAPGTPAVVTGWGTLAEGGSSPSILQQVSVQIVDRAKCKLQYEEFNEITDDMVCAGVPSGGKDACQGDSGGPLIADGKLVGIVSWGVGCARPDYSGVYSNVAYSRDWIVETANKALLMK